MSSIFHENIINIITQYTAEEYIVSFEKTEIVAVIPLCKNCRTFCQFRNKCHECIAKDRLEKVRRPMIFDFYSRGIYRIFEFN